MAKQLLGLVDPDVAARRVPVTDAQRRMIEGRYSNGKIFEAAVDGDELVVSSNGNVLERLVHIGGMRFRNPAKPDVVEWFVPDGARAGWWIYNDGGSYVEALRRAD